MNVRAEFDDYTLLQPLFPGSPRRDVAARDRYTEHYSLRGTVGAGGVGRVLLGFDERIGREVAIKEMLELDDDSDPAIRLRFLREARVTGRLEHPGIVPIYDLGTTPRGSPYYVMRFVRGDTLAQSLAACNMECPETALARRLQLLERLIGICEAMAYAHSMGVVHRDLKPGNIVLGPFGETMILDWGLAKIRGEDDQPLPDVATGSANGETDDLTRFGEILGTPSYMAPEQVDPAFGEVDTRTDVFALGCILFHLLMGHPPLRGGLPAIVERLCSPELMPSPSVSPIPVPVELIAICEKALAKDQALRFDDARALTEELRAYRDGRLVSTYAYTRRELLRRFVSHNKVPILAGLGILVAVLAGAGLAFTFGLEARQARNTAVAEGQLALQAQQRAESALADVTRISNENLTAADRLAADIHRAVDEIRKGLEQEARTARLTGNADRLQAHLESLHQHFPGPESFAATLAPGRIIAVAPTRYAGAIGADTSLMEHNRLALSGEPALSRVYEAPEGFDAITLVVPVRSGKAVAGFLSCRLKAAAFLGGLVPDGFLTAARTAWVIQDDGLILYDSDTTEIGKNLFREERFAELPELRQLAGRIAVQDAGVGYYQSNTGVAGKASNRIAAWETIRPTRNRRWKVVVLESWG